MPRRIVFLMGLALSAIPLFSQQSGQIVGTITDSTGAVVPGAAIKAIEVGTGFVRSTIAGSDGQFVMPNLRPTNYELTAEANGFRLFRRAAFELLANQSLTINIALEVGSVTETVNVAGAVVQVDTSTSTLSEVVDQSRIIELPLNGRDAAQLATLVPGTFVISVSVESGKSIPGGLTLSSNGSRQDQVSFKLDGITNTDAYFQENQSFPFPDALQEFSIQTSNYSAVSGNNAGAVVNVVTRSGTNDLHGGAFEFVRNRAFNARNTFSPTQDFLKRNQFGAYGGGPVRLPGYDGRNKTFFFAGWQGTRIRNVANSFSAFAPTAAQRTGDFSAFLSASDPANALGRAIQLRDPLGGNFVNNQIPVNRFDPAAVKVNTYIPAASGNGFTIIPRPIKHQLDQGVAKVDHQFTTNDRLSVRYFIDHFQNAGTYDPSTLLSYRNPTLTSRVRTQNAVATWTKTLSATVLNDLHFGINRVHAQRSPPSGVPSMQDLGVRLPLYPSKPSISQIEAQGFFNIGDNLDAKFPRTAFELGNRTGWILGRHNVQFGGEVTRQRTDITNEFRRGGHFVFSGDASGLSMADYFLGAIRTFDHGTGEYKNYRVTYSGLFVQDDFKINKRLTMNMGLRYEPTPPYHDTVGRITYFRPEFNAARVKSTKFVNAPFGETFRGDPNTPEDGVVGDFNNWGARLGFALDVFGDGKTSLRGGAGMFYDQRLNSEFNNDAVNAAPWNVRLNVTNIQGPLSDPYRGRNDFNLVTLNSIGDPNAPFPRPILIATYDGRQETPLNYNWNLAIEREVIPEWLARVAYVGSKSLYGRVTKQLNPPVFSGSVANPDGRRIYAADGIGSINYYTEDRRANFHSLQLSMTKRFSRGFTVLANYTWSKSIDNYGDFVMPYNFPNGDAMQKGPSDFDHRQRLVASWVWDLPEPAAANPFAKHVLKGWQWSGIGQYQTGGPFNIKAGRDNSGTLNNDRPKLTGISPDPVAGADKRVWLNPAAFAFNDLGTFGTLGRNVFYGPHLYSFDMGLFKNFRVTEQTAFQFRAEFFNIFNQTNFDNPVPNPGDANASLSAAGFGTFTRTLRAAGDPRIIQFALKFSF